MIYQFKSLTFKKLKTKFLWLEKAQNKKDLIALAKINSLDEIAVKLENNQVNKKLLIQKIDNIFPPKKTYTSDKELEYRRNAFSFFAELMAAKDFMKSSYKISIIPESKKKQPDFKISKNSMSKYIEVKQIRNPSEEDKNLYQNKYNEANVNSNFRLAIEKKIHCFCCDASEKFNKVKCYKKINRILVLDFIPGLDMMVELNDGKKTLQDVFDLGFWDKLQKIYNLTINIKCYFN